MFYHLVVNEFALISENYGKELQFRVNIVNNYKHFPTLLLLNMTCPVLANSVDPDQLASEEAN